MSTVQVIRQDPICLLLAHVKEVCIGATQEAITLGNLGLSNYRVAVSSTVSLGICPVWRRMRPDQRRGRSTSDRETPLITGVNGPLMARRADAATPSVDPRSRLARIGPVSDSRLVRSGS